MNYKLNYVCLKHGLSLILGHGAFAILLATKQQQMRHSL